MVEPPSTLAAAGDEKHGLGRVEPQTNLGRLRIPMVTQLGDGVPDRRSGAGDAGATQTGDRLVKSSEGFLCPASHQSIGPAGNGVGFVEKRRRTQVASGQHGGRSRETTHSQNGIRRTKGDGPIGEQASRGLPGAAET